MRQYDLEMTFRNRKLMAAYYYLPRRADDKCVRVEKHGPGLLVDLSVDGRPLGVEIAIPALITADSLNAVWKAYGLDPIDPSELALLKQAA